MLSSLFGGYRSDAGRGRVKSLSGILFVTESRLRFFFEWGSGPSRHTYLEWFTCASIDCLRHRRRDAALEFSGAAVHHGHSPDAPRPGSGYEFPLCEVRFVMPGYDRGTADTAALADFVQTLQWQRGREPDVWEQLYDLHDAGILSAGDIAAPQARLTGLALASFRCGEVEERTESWRGILKTLREVGQRHEDGKLSLFEFCDQKAELLAKLVVADARLTSALDPALLFDAGDVLPTRCYSVYGPVCAGSTATGDRRRSRHTATAPRGPGRLAGGGPP